MILVISVAVLVFIDQLVKKICNESWLEPITIIPNFIELTYLENRGAAFGIMQEKSLFLIVLPILIIGGLVFYYVKLGNTKADKLSKIALVLIISGAIGNLIDRIFNGYVEDMFHFTFFDFPVFNVADIYVVLGTFFLVIITLFLDGENKNG